jgi:hypothetical protein
VLFSKFGLERKLAKNTEQPNEPGG